MLGSLTGDLGALTRFGETVGKLGGSGAMTALSRELGDESLKLVAQGFAKEQDPYALPWFRKSYPDGRKVLQGESGRLAKSFAVKATGPWGVIIGSSLARSRFAQSGTGLYGPKRSRIYPKAKKAMRFKGAGGAVFARSTKGQQQRRMVPVRGVPSPLWNRALKKRAAAFYNGMLSKAGGRVSKIAA